VSIRVVCTNCRKKNKLRDELARSEAVCRKCGTSLAEPPPVQATEPVVVEPPPEEPDDGSLTGSRWNKWSLAAAREHWIGRSLERKRELERDGGDDRTRRGRRKRRPDDDGHLDRIVCADDDGNATDPDSHQRAQ